MALPKGESAVAKPPQVKAQEVLIAATRRALLASARPIEPGESVAPERLPLFFLIFDYLI